MLRANTSLQDNATEESEMAQDWYSTQPVAAMAPPPAPAMANLRPLSLGEILDRTFAIYRSRFWLFSGIAAIYAAAALVLQLLNLLVKHEVIKHIGFQSGSASELIGSGLLGFLLLMPYAVTQAATVYALGEVYLGKGTTAADSVRAVWGRWYRYVAIAVWISFSAFWLPLLLWIPAGVLIFALRGSGLQWLAGLLFFLGFCALPFGVWAVLRNLLGVQASVIESATVRTAMKRSKILTVGAKGRIFVVLLIMTALAMTLGMLQIPLAFVVMKAPLQEHTVAQAIELIINALGQTVVTPVGLIGMSLVYFDQRVRQEGFDLLLMLGPEVPVAAEPIVLHTEPVVAEPTAAVYPAEVQTAELREEDGIV
jgi:hypothetical protein